MVYADLNLSGEQQDTAHSMLPFRNLEVFSQGEHNQKVIGRGVREVSPGLSTQNTREWLLSQQEVQGLSTSRICE